MPDAPTSVLIVDDDPAVAKVVGALLRQEGIETRAAGSGELALRALAARPFDVVITDLRMPGMDGLELLAQVTASWPTVPVVMLTAHATVPAAVGAMKRGAADFVTKPFDRDELIFVVKKAVLNARYAGARYAGARDGEAGPTAAAHGELLGSSRPMRECRELIARAARGTATVLLRGESGTGKELAARAIHEQSPRAPGPFVKIYCAALPDALLESELFGYERGAFTGAVTRKPGRVELARGGTLFLDEIGDVTPAVQVKLLRLLQERAFERLGGVETHRADVRFVAATHRDLEGMRQRGEFRDDLFYRLSVIPIWLPALRDRSDDIELLARRFCEQLAVANGRPGLLLDDAAVALLVEQPWPGNVRQLQNFIERLVVLSDARVLRTEDVARELARSPLPPGHAGPNGTGAGASAGDRPDASAADGGIVRLEDSRRAAEREALETALFRAGGNRTLAARILGISRRTLYNKLEELKIG